MSYAMRPMGDYKTYGYAGDPGFLSSLWGVVKKVGKVAIGGMIGGPIGAVVAGTAGSIAKPAPQAFSLPGIVGGQVTFPGGTSVGMGYQPGTAMVPGQGRLPPYTATGPGVIPGGGRGGAMIPVGWHLDKKTGTRLVRNRRMNIANPRALRRAMRRTDGFVKLAKRALKGTGYAVRRA